MTLPNPERRRGGENQRERTEDSQNYRGKREENRKENRERQVSGLKVGWSTGGKEREESRERGVSFDICAQ